VAVADAVTCPVILTHASKVPTGNTILLPPDIVNPDDAATNVIGTGEVPVVNDVTIVPDCKASLPAELGNCRATAFPPVKTVVFTVIVPATEVFPGMVTLPLGNTFTTFVVKLLAVKPKKLLVKSADAL